MTKLLCILLVICMIFLGLSVSMTKDYAQQITDLSDELDISSGRSYDEGYEIGYEEGYSDANWELEDGYDVGYDEGYDDGHSDGYYAGATYTCLYFKDVDRAFRCAQNGSAWDTFIDAYDEYIRNIYDDESTRSELFWAFVSLMVSEDPTEAEIELLTSTFGKDLFIRNGVSLTP